MTTSAAAPAAWTAVEECLEAATGRDVVERARLVTELLEALEVRPELADPSSRRATLDALRELLLDRLAAIPLGEATGPARAATTLEMLVSLTDAPHRPEEDYPGLRARRAALSARLGLDRAMRRRLKHRVLFEHIGDMFIEGRPPHLLRGLFDLVLADEPVVSERARELCRALLTRLMSNFDHFLWYHLLREDRARARALFARNEGAEVNAALRGLLADDAVWARMIADEDLRHGGRTRLTLGERSHAGVEQLRRLVEERQPARWVDLAGGLNTFHRSRAPGMEGRPTIAVDLVRADADCLDNLVPLHAVWRTAPEGPPMSARILDDAEVEALRERMGRAPVEVRPANLLRLDALRAAVPPVEGATLYTCAAYLVSIRPQDEALRRRAQEARIPGPRVGALAMIENVLALLRPGDLLSLTGYAAVPYLRGVSWLNAEVAPGGGLRVRGLGHRRGFPGFALRWEMR
jgi:hypothetical protein